MDKDVIVVDIVISELSDVNKKDFNIGFSCVFC